MHNTTIVDAEVRVLHPEARHPDYASNTKEPVRNIIYEHSEFPLIMEKLSGESLIKSMDENKIQYGILSGIAWHDREILDKNNKYVAECVEQYSNRLRALYIADPSDPVQTAKEILSLDDSIYIGVELIPKWQKIHIDDKNLNPIFEAVKQKNIFFKAYTAHITQTLDGDSPYRLLQFLRTNPDLKVLVPHMGGLLCLYALIPEIKNVLKNAYFITSVSSTMEMVNFAAEINSDNLLFGSDFPFNHCHDQSTQLEYMMNTNMNETVKNKILGESAFSLFKFNNMM